MMQLGDNMTQQTRRNDDTGRFAPIPQPGRYRLTWYPTNRPTQRRYYPSRELALRAAPVDASWQVDADPLV